MGFGSLVVYQSDWHADGGNTRSSLANKQTNIVDLNIVYSVL